MNPGIQKITDLRIYNQAYDLSMDIFKLASGFPKKEMYSLTDQVIRSSRSVAANIREGYARREYEKVFIRHLSTAIGSAEETRTWLAFARDCNYVEDKKYKELDDAYDGLSAMIYRLSKNWTTFK